jgi:predicted GIY-YIG superfamily endonuclease
VTRAQTIQIFLPSGDPEGIRMASITTRTVKVFDVPRTLLPEFLKMSESQQVCVYYLVSDDAEGGTPQCYIGRSENFSKRVRDHKQKKEFWDRALVAVSLTNEWTVTHATYMEQLSISRAKTAGRYRTDNNTDGSKPHTPAPMEADCHEFIDTVAVLLTTLGVPVLDPVKTGRRTSDTNGDSSDEKLYYRRAGSKASGFFGSEGMLVLAGSTGQPMKKSSYTGRIGDLREKLRNEGVISMDAKGLVFLKDHLFPSPSAAGCILAGGADNGRINWKNADGLSINDLEQRALAEAESAVDHGDD